MLYILQSFESGIVSFFKYLIIPVLGLCCNHANLSWSCMKGQVANLLNILTHTIHQVHVNVDLSNLGILVDFM